MSRVVYKYPFDDSNSAAMDVPVGDVVLVAAQRPDDMLPTIWIDQYRDMDKMMSLTIVGTGHPVSDDLDYRHVGSAVCANGALVWHVYLVAS